MSFYADTKAHFETSTLTTGFIIQPMYAEEVWKTSPQNRYIVIRTIGNAGDKFVRNATLQVAFLSRINDTDLSVVANAAESLLKWILAINNSTDGGCIINYELLADLNGPILTASGRCQYWFELRAKSINTQ